MNQLDAFKQKCDVIWDIATLRRGPYRPPQYRRVMIPLTVLRRLDCVLEGSKDEVVALHAKVKAETTVKDGKKVPKYDAETIEKIINNKFKLTFHNTSGFTFQKLLGDADKLAPSRNSLRVFRPGHGRSLINLNSRKRSKSWMKRTASLKS